MDIFFENNCDKEFPDFKIDDLAELVIEKTLNIHNCPFDTQVSVYLVNSDEIHSINKDTRNIDKATDVLSFPNIEFDKIGDFSFLENDDLVYDYFDPDSGQLILGDIILCYEKIVSQAAEYGHSEYRETAFLIAHSILHLLGYDHMVDDERIEMEKMQNRILDELKIYRD